MYLKYDTAGVAFRLNLLSFQQGLKHLNFYVGITKKNHTHFPLLTFCGHAINFTSSSSKTDSTLY